MKDQVDGQNFRMQDESIEKKTGSQKAQQRQDFFCNFYEDAFTMMREKSLYTVSCQSPQANFKSKMSFGQAFRVPNPTFFQQCCGTDNTESQVRIRRGTYFNQLTQELSSLDHCQNIKTQSMPILPQDSENLKNQQILCKLNLNHEIQKQKILIDLSKTEITCIGYFNDSTKVMLFRSKKYENSCKINQGPKSFFFQFKVLMNESDSQILQIYGEMTNKGKKVPNIEFLNLEFKSLEKPQWDQVDIQIYSSK